MRQAELILVQPDGKVYRFVVRANNDAGVPDEKLREVDQSMIASLCAAMVDEEFRSNMTPAGEEDANKLKALFASPPLSHPASAQARARSTAAT